MIHAVGRIKKLTQTLRKVVVRDSSGGAGAVESGMAHIPGHHRSQLLLLPEVVDDYVAADNPVRFIEAFVDGLDLTALGAVLAFIREQQIARAEPRSKKAPRRCDQSDARLFKVG